MRRLKTAAILSLTLVLLSASVLLATRVLLASTAVEFEFTVDEISHLSPSDSPLRFALIADIHMRGTRRLEVSDGETTKTILGEFIHDMNEHVRPDFVVQLGDIIDGWTDECRPVGWDHGCSSASAETLISRIELVEELTERQTDIPWFDVIGNHEYRAFEADTGMTVFRAIDPMWRTIEDTWYYRDVKGYRLVFLNTVHPPPVLRRGGSHTVPEPQILWLRELLADTEKPTLAFMHVPISSGDGSDYDFTANQSAISELFAEDPEFVAGFFGHSHHTDSWDGLRMQLDEAGNLFFHIPAPHEWMGNASQHPWAVVNLRPQDRALTVEVGSGVVRSEAREMYDLGREVVRRNLEALSRRLGRGR